MGDRKLLSEVKKMRLPEVKCIQKGLNELPARISQETAVTPLVGVWEYTKAHRDSHSNLAEAERKWDYN